MPRPFLANVCAPLLLCALTAVPLHAQEKPPARKGLDPATLAALEKMDVRYYELTPSQVPPAFAGPGDADGVPLMRLPKSFFMRSEPFDIPVPFGTRVDWFNYITVQEMSALASLPNLVWLRVDTFKQDAERLQAIARSRSIIFLHLDNTEVVGLSELARMKQLKALKLTGAHMQDDCLLGLPTLENVTTLDLNPSHITDKGMRQTGKATHLTALDLRDTRVTDRGLEELAGFKKLSALGLGGGPMPPVNQMPRLNPLITDAGMKHVAGLTNLTALYLGGASVTDAGLKELAGLDRLETLDLRYTKIKDDGLRHLAGLRNMTTLDLRGTAVTDEGLKHLAGMTNLVTLRLTYCKVTGTGLKDLAGCKKLATLDIPYVSEAGLKEAAALKSLTTLSLGRVRETSWLKHLAPLTNLTTLRGGSPSKDYFDTLRAIGLLHAVVHAMNKDGGRPRSADEVVEFDLRGQQTAVDGPEMLRSLKAFKNLSRLQLDVLQGTRVGGLRETGNYTLKALNEEGLLHALPGAVGKDGARPKSIDEMEAFTLNSLHVNDEGLKNLSGMKNLETLRLICPDVTDKGLKELVVLKKLRSLDVSGTSIRGAGFTAKLGLDSLESLKVGKFFFAYPSLVNLKKLRSLDLSAMTFGVDVKSLSRLEQLESLTLAKSSLSDSGLEQLRKALPKCKITR